MTRTILAAAELPFSPEQWDRFKAAIGSDELVVLPGSEMDRELPKAEIAVLAGDLDDRFVNAPKLKWVHCDHAGLTKSARPEVFERGLVVTGSAGRSGEALAEHVMMFALMLTSNYPRFYDAQREHRWVKRTPQMDALRALYGKTIGIIGMGHTGLALATRAKAFNMTVLGYRRRDGALPAGVDRMYCSDRGDNIDPILAEADVLALVVNLSNATYRMIDAAALGRMKRGSILINLGRGKLIDTDALIAALETGHLAGAGLDVTDPEPLPPEHPLWDAPNVLITPHFTAALPDKVDRSLNTIIENLRRYRAGEPLLNQTTREDIWTQA